MLSTMSPWTVGDPGTLAAASREVTLHQNVLLLILLKELLEGAWRLKDRLLTSSNTEPGALGFPAKVIILFLLGTFHTLPGVLGTFHPETLFASPLDSLPRPPTPPCPLDTLPPTLWRRQIRDLGRLHGTRTLR